MANKFDDENAMLFHLNNAFKIHPYNKRVMVSLNRLIDVYLAKNINSMGDQEISDYAYHIDTLLQFEALTDNSELRNLKGHIKAARDIK